MLRPKLIPVTPAGTAGDVHSAWVYVADAANHGLDVQYDQTPAVLRVYTANCVVDVDLYQARREYV